MTSGPSSQLEGARASASAWARADAEVGEGALVRRDRRRLVHGLADLAAGPDEAEPERVRLARGGADGVEERAGGHVRPHVAEAGDRRRSAGTARELVEDDEALRRREGERRGHSRARARQPPSATGGASKWISSPTRSCGSARARRPSSRGW